MMIRGAFAVLYMVSAHGLFHALGLLEHLDQVMFSAHDSQGYEQFSEYLLGNRESVPEPLVRLRPFLFPAYLAVAKQGGAWAYMVLQQALNACSILLVFGAIRGLTDSVRLAALGAAMMLISLTFTLVTAHALTEPLAVLLTACVVWLFSRDPDMQDPRITMLAAFVLAVGCCIKPVLLLPLLLWWGVAAIRLGRLLFWPSQQTLAAVLALLPLLTQLAFSASLTGSANFSSAGGLNFSIRFFPAVYGYARAGEFASYKSEVAAQARAEFETIGSQLGFVVAHPVAALRATGHTLRANVLSATQFASVPDSIAPKAPLADRLVKLSSWVNRVMALLHLTMLGLAGWFCWRGPDGTERVFVGVGAAWIAMILLTSTLTYWQGDRVIVVGLPIWCVLYTYLAHLSWTWFFGVHPLAGLANSRSTA